MQEEKKYYVYVVTDTVNGYQYIGCHKNGSEWDGYLGSGTHIKKALLEHGRDAFSLEVSSKHNDRLVALEAERSLIEKYIKQGATLYNIQYNNTYAFNYSSIPELDGTSIRLPKELREILISMANLNSGNISSTAKKLIERGLGAEKLTKDNVLSTRVDDTVFEKVEKLAKKQKVNKAKILNQAIHLYLNGSVKEPVKQNYVQANPHEAVNTMLKPTLTLPDPDPKYQEAFHLTGKLENVNMLQIMTASRRKMKGLAYDKSMEQYFYLIKSPKQNSPSRLDNG